MDELDIKAGLSVGDFIANFADDAIDVPFTLILEFDREVSRVGFRDGKDSHLQAGTARRAFDFRSLLKNAFDVVENAICFLKGTARWHDVIQNESTLIERWKEAGTKLPVGQV